MKTTKDFKRFLSELMLWIFMVTSVNPVPAIAAYNSSLKIIYPLKQISKLECRFKDFKDLSASCKQDLPILKTKDYVKYASLNWGYNDFTRTYTMLSWASYKYGWDVWNGWHIWTDIATSKWTPVYSMADWKVIAAKTDVFLWKLISIEHTIRWKTIVSNYAHLSQIWVKVWNKVKVWTKIWEVWSTWNSTWNHLHFQIDLDTPFHPYYYDYNKCPYSYYELSENGRCQSELLKNTIDPLLFLETAWAVLEKISTKTITKTVIKNTDNTDLSIFNRTVYIWYWTSDIKKVQKIFKKLWIYRWKISWDYNDIEDTIIAYQISNNLIKDKLEYWAWRFWPKTRASTKKDYLKFLENWTTTTVTQTEHKSVVKTQRINRTKLMSREEIEKREVEEFLKNYNIDLNLINKWWNIKTWDTETLKLKITDRKWKVFKWKMPWSMTFVVDKQKVGVFPEKLFFFTDWKRDIKLTWIKEGNTNLYVKIGTKVVKTIPLKVLISWKTVYPESSKIFSSSKITLWDKQTWAVLFKDWAWKNMINLAYGSTFNIKASGDNKVCIKEGNINNIRKIYRSSCKTEDYKNELNFTYQNTVWGILIYDYIATTDDFNITVKNNYNNKVLSEKKLIVTNPKWLNKTYAYTNEVMEMLQAWVVDWINKWYFLEKRWLTQRNAYTWVENALHVMINDVYDNETKQILENNITKVKKAIPYSSRTKKVTRKEFLDLTNTYLVTENTNKWKVDYRDIDYNTSQKLAIVFDENTKWKDQFGEKYFRPDITITRWEWAYFIAKTLNKIAKSYLTLN